MPSNERSGGERDDPAPAGGRHARHDKYGHRYDRCTTDEQRRKVIADAWAELKRVRTLTAEKPTIRRATPEAIGRDPRPVQEVAHDNGISQRRVYQLRAAARSQDRAA